MPPCVFDVGRVLILLVSNGAGFAAIMPIDHTYRAGLEGYALDLGSAQGQGSPISLVRLQTCWVRYKM